MTQPATPRSLQFKVGVFTLLGLLLIGAITVYVNDKPYWWRGCDKVTINVDDATGLKTKSPIRSLGLEIGYLQSVELSETHVKLGICITAPVEVLPSTRAYIRGEGFLGDKFVELKPVRYLGGEGGEEAEPGNKRPSGERSGGAAGSGGRHISGQVIEMGAYLWNALAGDARADEVPPAEAPLRVSQSQAEPHDEQPLKNGLPSSTSTGTQDPPPATHGGKARNIPVGKQSQDIQALINQVDGLVGEMSQLTSNLREAINPQELRKVMTQLNKTLENASRTLSPEGGLTTTAQRTLAKLEDAIEHLRDQMARVNRGEGTIGKLLNDPSYAEELRQAIRNLNLLLTKVAGVRFVANLGAEQIWRFDGARGFFQLGIWPTLDRYYLLGVTLDPRGRRTITRTTTEAGGTSSQVRTTQIEEGGINFTAMLGKVILNRLDFSAGILHGDGTGSLNLLLGPSGREEQFQVRYDLYSRGRDYGLDGRFSATLQPFGQGSVLGNLYVRGGLEGLKKVDESGLTRADGQLAWFVGGGIRFDDQDIKLLFALR